MTDRPPTPRQAQIAALMLPLDQLPDPLPIPVIERPFDVSIRPPGSKSITNRALLLAALADGTSELRGPLIDADDAQVMLRAIQQLGAKVEIERGRDGGLDIVRITGVNGRWKIGGAPGETVTLNLNNAGTATRFLTAAAILAPSDSGGIIIDGDARMRERPIGELVDALRQLGVRVECLATPGYPPLRVHPHAPFTDRLHISFGHTMSSQFISAAMLVGPFLPRGMTVTFPGSVSSVKYIYMTQLLLHQCGRKTERDATSLYRPNVPIIHIPGGGLPAFTLDVESDASGATYFAAAAAMIPGARTRIANLSHLSLQGDANFFAIIDEFGALTPDHCTAIGSAHLWAIDADLSNMPDTAMTAAAIACFATPTSDNPTATTTLRGLRTLRVKETDRLAALQTELSKLGAHVEIFKDGDDEGLRITPPLPSALGPAPSALSFDTYNDHRMAMALALIGLRRPNVYIRNPACVAKTYPTFWQDLARLYA